jgi:16S rRNA (guanine966-N2)-methyltransferase
MPWETGSARGEDGVRVTGGAARGRPLHSPTAPGVRPTTDRVRSALFSILAPYGIEGSVAADLYAGTGALGIEALSRGAEHVDFVEMDRRQVDVIRKNLRETGTSRRAQLIASPVEQAVERLDRRYDFLLMDPPYTKPFPSAVLERIGERALLNEGGLVVCGHASRVSAPERCGRLVRVQDRRYGDASLAFYQMEEDVEEWAA